MSEMQRSPDNCVKCGVNFSSAALSVMARPRKRGKTYAVAGVIGLSILLVAGGYFGLIEYRKQAVIDEAGHHMRAANGYVAEMLDEKASRTTAEFLEKLPRRIQSLDDLNARVLAMDDSLLPGLKGATADYIRASRAFLSGFADMQRAEISLSVAKAGHAAYDSYVSSHQGRSDLALSDAQIKAELDIATAKHESASTMSEKITALGISAKILSRSRTRLSYLSSLDDVNEASRQAEMAKRSFEAARDELSTAGRKLSELADEPMPVQPWFDK
ncbi:hypothetical protein [Stutzerimonas chloritidismutans]|uniref:Uncharacterized protein n=1 Tax=Stutzerimonas chloritidismutans TaxID=203192 RepID=A0ACC5VGP4_STUCH|nr:hypothetical protein [Stutzerimonas chloritidismutans]MBX7271120.1 hypothetical protein [Stutzerimonas chloritidismutans]